MEVLFHDDQKSLNKRKQVKQSIKKRLKKFEDTEKLKDKDFRVLQGILQSNFKKKERLKHD